MKPMVTTAFGRPRGKPERRIVKLATLFSALAVALVLVSCSSSKKAEGENPDEAPPAESASTDAVPQDSAEKNPDQKTDGTSSATTSTTTSTQSSPATDAAATGSTSSSSMSSGASTASGGGNTGATTAPDPGAGGSSVSSPSSDSTASSGSDGSGQGASSAQPSSGGSSSGMGSESYSVRGGDSLMKIAFDTYGDIYQWRKIWEMNRDTIKDPNRIPAGTVIRVERPAAPVSVSGNGEKYLIRKGDTLGSIAQEVYGSKSKWRKLFENNRQLIRDPNKIFAGFFLYYLPDGDAPAQKKPTPLASKILENAEKKGATGGTGRSPASAGSGTSSTSKSAGKK